MKQFHYSLTRRFDSSAWVRLAVILVALALSQLLIWTVASFPLPDGWKAFFFLLIIFGVAVYFSYACTCRPEYELTFRPSIHIDAKTDHAEVQKAIRAQMGQIPHNYG